VRNDAEGLFSYLSAKDPDVPSQTRLVTLVEWALTTIHNRRTNREFDPNDNRLRAWRCNHNASMLLSTPSQRMSKRIRTERGPDQRRITDHVLDFIRAPSEPSLVSNTRFAGHFQRIFVHLLRVQEPWSSWMKPADLDRVVTTAITNIDCVAYQQLLMVLVTDFSAQYSEFMNPGNPGQVCFDLFVRMLRGVCDEVRVIHACCVALKQNSLVMSLACSRCNEVAAHVGRAEHFMNRPINWFRWAVP
jgi:hypothetical protein